VNVIIEEYKKAWKGVYPIELDYQRSEMQPQFASIATPSEIVISTSFPAGNRRHFRVRSISACRMRRWSRSAMCCIRRPRGTPSRWIGAGSLLTREIQAVEVTMVAELAKNAHDGRAIAGHEGGRFHRARSPDRASRPRSMGSRLFECQYGTHNAKYAIRIDKSLSNAGSRLDGGIDMATDDKPDDDRPLQATAPPIGRRRWRAKGDRVAPLLIAGGVLSASRPSPFDSGGLTPDRPSRDINMVLDIPVQLSVELGRTKVPIKHILQLGQGSVVELDALAGEPMDVLVNGYLIAQGEVVVVNDKFGIRLTDVVTPRTLAPHQQGLRAMTNFTRMFSWRLRFVPPLLALLGSLLAHGASHAQGNASLPLLIGSGPSGTNYSVPIQTLLFFTALSFLPAILLMMTGFTRIVIVLSLLRQAIGTQSAPPNQVIIGLSLFLTLFVMGPTLDRVYQDAYLPYTHECDCL
jgi:flagellar motor switch protein FliN